MREGIFWKSCAPGVVNPPYLEAMSEVKTLEVRKGDFMVAASDGLWNHLASKDAVLAVGMWIKTTESRGLKNTSERRTIMIRRRDSSEPQQKASRLRNLQR